jgi:nucleotide-binding universal stress UspA family protein
VLVATDFSELGDRAVPYAYAAAGRGGVVHLLHVIETPPIPNPLYAHYAREPEARTPEERDKVRHEVVARLRQLVPEDASARGIDTLLEAVDGPEVSPAICSAAERLGADLICLSSHGRSGISKAIAGSVAQDVMVRSKRPLLVIRPPTD